VDMNLIYFWNHNLENEQLEIFEGFLDMIAYWKLEFFKVNRCVDCGNVMYRSA